MKVAVILCVYKCDDPIYLETSINSILKQSYKCDLKIYVDGYIDKRINDVIEKFKHLNNLFVYYGAKNKGLAFGLNYLIDKCLKKNYEYIARMDSDDISHLERIEKQIEYFGSHSDIDVLGTSCREFGASFSLDEKHLPKTHEQLLLFSITRCPFIHPTVMFRRRVFEMGFRYPVNTVFTEDMALWFELLSAGFKFANLNKILLDYRLTEDTVNRRRGIKKANSEIRLRLKYMRKLNKISIKNIIFIFSRICFHLLPTFLSKIAYKNLRKNSLKN